MVLITTIILGMLCLFQLTSPANIFVSSSFGGSHAHSMYSIAEVLADTGHNVTLVNLEEGTLDSYHHPGIHGYTVKRNAWSRGEVAQPMRDGCITPALEGPSSRLGHVFGDKECVDFWKMVFERSSLVYGGEEIQDIFEGTQFDVILSEAADLPTLSAVGKFRNIPVVSYMPVIFIITSAKRSNLPILLTSQPSPVFHANFHRPQTFWERLDGLLFVWKMMNFISASKEAAMNAAQLFGYSTAEEVADSVKLYLTNDHPAFSFPFLRPPSNLPVGAISLLHKLDKPAVLSQEIEDFVGAASGRPVVYVSFGSYLDVDETPWFRSLVDTLEKLGTRTILKVGSKTTNRFPENVLPLVWVPQVDLLKSGMVRLFVSHCGNNGRIETIFFTVPVLCIPLCSDQGVNSELVKWRGFGELLFKEEVQDRLQDVVSKMLENHEYYRHNMERASNIVKQEPGNVRDRLLFYIDQLARHKNLDYLENRIIKQQNFVEIYNLDIIALVLVVVLAVIVMFIIILHRSCRALLRVVFRQFVPKIKAE